MLSELAWNSNRPLHAGALALEPHRTRGDVDRAVIAAGILSGPASRDYRRVNVARSIAECIPAYLLVLYAESPFASNGVRQWSPEDKEAWTSFLPRYVEMLFFLPIYRRWLHLRSR